VAKKPKSLTKAELRVMNVLWDLGRGTVAQVTAALPPPPAAYTTVLTILRILEQKGAVQHEADGRAHVYMPAIEREAIARFAVADIVQSFFQNSKSALALRLIAESKPSAEELRSLKALIAQHEEHLQ
jgi:BlaI family transcriptional regulator, penicillinase repressor